MKNYILGFLSAALLYGLAANAIDIKLEEITVRDLYISQIMNAYLINKVDSEYALNMSTTLADKMIERRKKR